MKRFYIGTYFDSGDGERDLGFIFNAEKGQEKEAIRKTLSKMGLPIIADNDSVSYQEIKLEDYDIILVPKGTQMPHSEEARDKIQARGKEVITDRGFYE